MINNDAFADILAANEQYVANFDLPGLPSSPKKHLAVLTCIDSRIEPLKMLGLKPGDAKILRNAGARVTNDTLRTLVLTTHFLNVDRIMIVIHTDCTMHTSREELLRVIDEHIPGVDFGSTRFHATPEPYKAIQEDVEQVRASPMIADDVEVAGFEYNVETGALRQITD